ncbi:MAG: alcohol dehydrogenase catalytic domain-containing protein [Bifidobacteriaceae bacterium]|jgi:threonine dehydrogenase-like Zn-dependent dehydrogenase|nr:alcohol dehydrogenase catalytic domain-containing protein [Bifidobacteriaceae bacterium]
MSTMRGYIFEDINKPAWRDDIPIPVPERDEIVIKPVIVAPCTSDVHILETGALPTLKGKPMGHEAAGLVHAIGPDVKLFKPGDKVAIPATAVDWCVPAVQNGYDKYIQLSPYSSPDPRLGGCFAEYMLVQQGDLNCAVIPDGVTWEQAVACTDMATTAFEGVEWLDLRFGQTVVVYGIGAVGQMALAAAALKGAARIIGIGSRPITFEVGAKMGGTDFIDYRNGDVVAQVLELNGGPVDAVITCGGGDISAMTDALRMVPNGGRVANVAFYAADSQWSVPTGADSWWWGLADKTVRGLTTRGGRGFLERLLLLAKYGRFHPEYIVTHTYHGMDHIPEALDKMGGHDRTAIKPVVFFD